MARLPGTLSAQTSTLNPGGNLILLIGTSAALVAVSFPGNGANVEVAMFAGMPCFQAGAGAAGVWAWADRAPKVNETTMPSCLNRCVEMYFTEVSKLFFKAPNLLNSIQCVSDRHA
jgi:hypothetical protein